MAQLGFWAPRSNPIKDRNCSARRVACSRSRESGAGPDINEKRKKAQHDNPQRQPERLDAVLAHIRERQDAYGPAWNRDLRPATRSNLRRAAEGSGLTSLSGADP